MSQTRSPTKYARHTNPSISPRRERAHVGAILKTRIAKSAPSSSAFLLRQKQQTRENGKVPWGGKTPNQVRRRNERERRRVQAVNRGYEDLAELLIDWEELKHKKLTKAQTLKAAILYIEHLEDMLKLDGSAHLKSHQSPPSDPSAGGNFLQYLPIEHTPNYSTFPEMMDHAAVQEMVDTSVASSTTLTPTDPNVHLHHTSYIPNAKQEHQSTAQLHGKVYHPYQQSPTGGQSISDGYTPMAYSPHLYANPPSNNVYAGKRVEQGQDNSLYAHHYQRRQSHNAVFPICQPSHQTSRGTTYFEQSQSF